MVELCPVCLKAVEEEYPPYKARYKGKEYTFHTVGCREAFLKDPEKYLKDLSSAGEHSGKAENQ
jgi:YHS domain-containing protein